MASSQFYYDPNFYCKFKIMYIWYKDNTATTAIEIKDLNNFKDKISHLYCILLKLVFL